jgi:hypothetical protein
MMSTLSQAIHGDVVTLGGRMEQLHIRAEQLQTHADRESRHQNTLWREQQAGPD